MTITSFALLAAANAVLVNPFIGTQGKGHCNPGAACPFGMVQPGPDTGCNHWNYCAGYQYLDTTMMGFSQNHLNGTGQGEMGDFLLLPQCGETLLEKSAFSHDRETAEPGYYAVTLDDAAVRAEITCTERVAYHRYTYLGDGPKRLLVDFQHGLIAEEQWADRMTLEGKADFRGDREIRGYRIVRQYWPLHKVNCDIRFSRPVKAKRLVPNPHAYMPGERWLLDFDVEKGGTLEVKVALSYTDVAGAVRNLDAEIPGWNFEEVRAAAKAKWQRILGQFRIDGATDDQRTMFYTSLYHLCYQPNVISDAGATARYSTFSLWDTYRAAHPLYTFVTPGKVTEFVGSFLDHAKRTGYMPIWTIYGLEGYDMVASHSIPVLLDAYRKGLWKDLAAFYPYVRHTQTTDNRAGAKKDMHRAYWDLQDRLGYFPCDVIPWGNLSRAMETTLDDWCAAEMAKELGHAEDERFFRARSGKWRNSFKPGTGWLCPRKSDGSWIEGYDPCWLVRPKEFGGVCADATEGSGVQWSFHVLHDVPGLVAAMGGREKFLEKLDFLFEHRPFWEGREELEMVYPYREACGRVGEYSHGNEPCHHIAWLYSAVGARARTVKWVKHICAKHYPNTPGGMSGNDDCGQISAWYVFAAMGFYPVNPASAEYVLGEPLFDRLELNLPSPSGRVGGTCGAAVGGGAPTLPGGVGGSAVGRDGAPSPSEGVSGTCGAAVGGGAPTLPGGVGGSAVGRDGAPSPSEGDSAAGRDGAPSPSAGARLVIRRDPTATGVTLRGIQVKNNVVSHADLMKGGELVFGRIDEDACD